MTIDPRFLSKKIRGGSIDVHPTEKALIVHYETEAAILCKNGDPMIGDKKKSQKIIRLKNLNSQTDIVDLSKTIVENCKLISPAKLPQIEHLLRYLLKRKLVNNEKAPSNSINRIADPGAFESTEIDETANMTDVDEYLELLYEDTSDKLRASALILQLARNPDNLEELYQNEILIGALARVLREDWKKSTDLTTNLVYVFFCFSSFTGFHGVILHFKIGALTMRILEHELEKYSLWLNELDKKKFEEGEDSLIYKTSENKFHVLLRKQEQLFRVAIYLLLNIAENVEVESKIQNKKIVSLLCKCLTRKNYDLLILVISFLKKLSMFQENINDMVSNKLVEHLFSLLSSEESDLISLILRLIYNLTFSSDLRNSMIQNGYIQRISSFLKNASLRSFSLRILYQLSVDDNSKQFFVDSECLPTLMRSILENPESESELECIALAINLACNKRAAVLIGEVRGIRMLMKRAFKYNDSLIMKLLRNLSEHDEIKLKFVDFLPDLVRTVLSLKENSYLNPKKCSIEQALSVDRNLTSQALSNFNINSIFEEVDDEDDNSDIMSSENDFALECLGLLANLNLKEIDFPRVLIELKLLTWLARNLTLDRRNVEDDILLEIIRLIGTTCIDSEAATLIANTTIVSSLIDLLNSKQNDDEIVCQILHVFCKLTMHTDSCNNVLQNTQVPSYLIDLMHDKNQQIRRLCCIALDILSENDDTLAERVQCEKFKWHNSQWLEMINFSGQEIDMGSIDNNYPLKRSYSDLMNFDDDNEDDNSDKLVMASTLLENANDWFPRSSLKQSITDSTEFEPFTERFGHLNIFSTSDAYEITPQQTKRGDSSDLCASFVR